MSARFGGLRGLAGKQDVILNAICLLFAVVFLMLAAANFTWSGDFLTIDSLFVTTVFALLALVFLANPLLWAHERGYIRSFLAAEDELTAKKDAEPVHFEGSVKLFGAVLFGLLVLTVVEVALAYIEVGLVLMLTILIGLSVIKAGLIMAYFMHLKFERQSLVMALIPALVICICLLFVFFPDGFRLLNTRPPSQPSAPAGATQPTH
ncbi:MAG TPA: cytochrome C oxidase subunit IV family protein [Pyrinomonadaceae bacterium]|nr:cytochrome C oxidase subunit IV family protein [Pyrinomonadaceae bacterium]